MGSEILKDEEGKEHYIFDQSELYNDDKMGDKIEDFEILQIRGDSRIKLKIIQSYLNQKIYSMKSISIKGKKDFGPKALEALENQIKEYQNLDYFFILKMYKYFKDEKFINIIFEHTNNGSLKDFIKLHSSLDDGYIKECSLLNMYLQCIKALNFLHSKNIIHKSISPKHLLMTNEKLIKLELCPKIEQIDIYKPPEKDYSEKGDIYSLGCVFYQMCFLVEQDKFQEESKKFEQFEKADTAYSKEFLDIIKSMVEKDPNKRPSSEELFIKIRDLYDKEIIRNTSITSLITCLYSINNLAREFLQNKSKFSNKNETPISFSFFNCLINIEDSDKNKWNESIKNFRRYLGTKNPKLDGDKEVDPFFLMVFIVENMHKELNQKHTVDFDINQGYLIKRKEDKTNKQDMVINFFRYFKEHFNSIISKTFFGIMKNKNICKECGLKTYSFNCFCFLYFDIDKLVPNEEKNTLKLQDFFNGLKEGKFTTNFKNKFFCKGCSKLTEHNLEKGIYYTPKSLIICFISKNNYNYEIDYPDFVNLENEREYSLSPKNFKLKGFINKIDENKNEKYISYFKSPINEEIFCCENDIKEEDGWVKKKGKTVILFYEEV